MRYIFILSLVGYMSGCASAPEPIVIREPIEVLITEYEAVPVPLALLAPCHIDLGPLETNADIHRALAAALIELRRCTADKDAIGELE
jgi:hypothetical protein